ncbi:hypothetical protein JEQ12_010007 [Ovis aries]|uniref:Uncharacterized protein n=1 Tax=Ovis aries TaxID=9940 RepID=A0A836D5Y8_SHEEP|nr:hypothetical protein JEQ12_010007 [Ovis aries]
MTSTADCTALPPPLVVDIVVGLPGGAEAAVTAGPLGVETGCECICCSSSDRSSSPSGSLLNIPPPMSARAQRSAG